MPPVILFLSTFLMGARAVRISYFAQCFEGRLCRPYLTFSRRISGQFSFFTSLLIHFVQTPRTLCCSHHHLSSATKTTIYPLPQSLSSILCCSCHHLPPAAIAVTDYLLESLPPVIYCRYHRPPPRALLTADVLFLYLIRSGYTSATGHSSLLNNRLNK